MKTMKMMRTKKMKICLCAVISFCMLACTKEKQPPSIDYYFKLSSDPVPSRVTAQADRSAKIRLYVDKKDYKAPVNYFFSYTSLEGQGTLSNSVGNMSYEAGKSYWFSDSTTKVRDTLDFKYFPSTFSFPSFTAPVKLNFIVKNSQGYRDTLEYKTTISLL